VKNINHPLLLCASEYETKNQSSHSDLFKKYNDQQKKREGGLTPGSLSLIERAREKVVDDGFVPFEELVKVLQPTLVVPVLEERESC
jgi:hypothetical protein